LVAFLRQL